MFARYVGAKTVYLIIVDGGADWMSAVQMICAKFPWMSGLHCISHCGSLTIKDIWSIAEVTLTLTNESWNR